MSVFRPDVYHAARARRPESTWDWLCRYGAAPTGDPFDPDLYPHVKRVCDLWDNPRYPLLWLDWATRLGKTTGLHGCVIAAMAQIGGDAVLAAPTKDLLERQVEKRLWPIARGIDRRLGGQLNLPPEHKQGLHEIELAESTLYGVWSGSPTALGDLDAIYLAVTEADKFNQAASGEADPILLVRERTKNNPDARGLIESTPGTRHLSRIEAGLKTSTRETRWVPCPHCGKHAVLQTKQIVWDKLPDGSTDPDLAYRTARWQCPSCRKEAGDHHRGVMLRGGVWAPEGCYVDRAGRVKGQPARQYTREAGLHLSSHYSLQLSWGDLAREFSKLCKTVEGLRHWSNSWEAVTWSPLRSTKTWEQVGQRLALAGSQRGVVPAWCQVLTLQVDVQIDRWPWWVMAHAPDGRRHLVDWGHAWSWSEVDELVERAWPWTDGREPTPAPLIGCDSGERTLEVYLWVRDTQQRIGPGRRVLAVKGDQRTDSGRWRLEVLGVTTRARRKASRICKGQTLLHVPCAAWEAEVHALLEEREPAAGLTIPEVAATDAELLEDFTNGTQDRKGVWVKADKEKPNDWRDCCKYSLCLVEAEVEHYRRGHWPAEVLEPAPAPPPITSSTSSSRGPGRRPVRRPTRRPRRR